VHSLTPDGNRTEEASPSTITRLRSPSENGERPLAATTSPRMIPASASSATTAVSGPRPSRTDSISATAEVRSEVKAIARGPSRYHLVGGINPSARLPPGASSRVGAEGASMSQRTTRPPLESPSATSAARRATSIRRASTITVSRGDSLSGPRAPPTAPVAASKRDRAREEGATISSRPNTQYANSRNRRMAS
jgi:hypothetical protein